MFKNTTEQWSTYELILNHFNLPVQYYSSLEASTCFSPMSKVKLENGKLVTMSELNTGTYIQTGIDLHLSFLANPFCNWLCSCDRNGLLLLMSFMEFWTVF